MSAKKILIGLILVLILVLLFQNTGEVTLNLLFWGVEVPQYLLIILSVLAGFIVGYLTCLMAARKKNRRYVRS